VIGKVKKIIKEILKRSGHTKTDMAKKIGVERMTLHNWLKGRTNAVSKAHQLRIREVAKKYEVKISD